MQDEFELTYLIKDVPAGLKDCPSKEILDIYLPAASDHAQLRVRMRGDKYEITKKQPAHGTDSSHQIENTIPLTKEEFDELAQLAGKRVHKIRYYYPEAGIDYEIDVFQDGLLGLILVDVEFTSNEAKAAFVSPTWVLADVTQEKFIAGGVLCGKSIADITTKLAQYAYKQVSI
jgi:CYTH domain-containing protein